MSAPDKCVDGWGRPAHLAVCAQCNANVDPDVSPLLGYIDQLDRDGGLTSAVSDKLRSLIKGLNHDLA